MISLCLIVKDEGKNLRDFLNHHSDLFDELIIVDTGSKDDTASIAKEFTDKVFSFKWNDDFSEARNFSISKATKDYILWLDPDERISKKDFEKIKGLNKEEGYSFIQKSFTENRGHPRYKDGCYIRRICKLFRNNNIKFIYPIHETVVEQTQHTKTNLASFNGENFFPLEDREGKNFLRRGNQLAYHQVMRTDIIIEHYPEESKEKSEYYLKLLEKKKNLFPESNWEKEIKTESTSLKCGA